MNRRKMLALMSAAPVAPYAYAQGADTYPNKPVKIYIPLAAGSAGETFTRFFADKLSKSLGQPFVVENAPGGNGIISAMAVKNAPADGYTMLQGTGFLMSVNPVTLKNLPYDPVKDFKPVSGILKAMIMIVVPVGSPVHTLADLIAFAKKSKDPLNAGTYSPSYQLALAWFASLAGIKVSNVPYKGASQVAMDVVGNQLDFGLSDVAGVASLVKSGKLRGLAVSGGDRHPDFPEMPTMRESGFADYVTYTWASLFVRSATPDSIVAKLWGAMEKAFKTQEAQDAVSKSGGSLLMPLGPAEMRKFQLEEAERDRQIAKAAGFQPQ
jgi:tripartite-type tricarboxylate transporter receptor subunit TctC